MLRMLSPLLGAATLVCGLTALANACPVITTGSTSLNYSATQLSRPASMGILAGGDIDLANCPQVPGLGHVVSRPDFSLFFDRNASRSLEFRTQGGCDTILLINTGAGNYYYDDDDGSGSNAKIRLTSPSNGRYDIWVGTYDSATCNAQLVLETFR